MLFDLYRIKMLEPAQVNLFVNGLSRPELLREIVTSLPQNELRAGHVWMLGNTAPLDAAGVYMRIGRDTKRSIETYSNGNFTDTEFSTAPYTHVILDVDLEVAAIAQKPSLSPSTRTIANSLVKLLSKSPSNADRHVEFKADPMNDPEPFLEALNTAFQVTRFTFTFNRPNPFDAERLIVKPLQHTLRTANGTNGQVTLAGDELQPAALQDIARSVAAGGEDASAKLRVAAGQQAITKRLSGDPARISGDPPDTLEAKSGLLAKMRQTFAAIRGVGGN